MSDYHAYVPGLRSINGSDWMGCSGFTLADTKKSLHYDDLVEDKGPTELIFLPSEMEAARQRTEMMNKKYEDLVVTLVVKSRFSSPVGTIRVESIRYSLLAGRIAELKQLAEKGGGHVFIITAYSEETKQEFWWNDLELVNNMPRMPGYDQKYERKRTAYRNTTSGVMR